MPPIFKALATITVWVLFILGCIMLLGTNIGSATAGALFGPKPPPIQLFLGNGAGTVSLALAVVCMKLRQMLE